MKIRTDRPRDREIHRCIYFIYIMCILFMFLCLKYKHFKDVSRKKLTNCVKGSKFPFLSDVTGISFNFTDAFCRGQFSERGVLNDT